MDKMSRIMDNDADYRDTVSKLKKQLERNKLKPNGSLMTFLTSEAKNGKDLRELLGMFGIKIIRANDMNKIAEQLLILARSVSVDEKDNLEREFKNAIKNGDTVKFEYTKKDGSTKAREITPTQLIKMRGRDAVKGVEVNDRRQIEKMFYLDMIGEQVEEEPEAKPWSEVIDLDETDARKQWQFFDDAKEMQKLVRYRTKYKNHWMDDDYKWKTLVAKPLGDYRAPHTDDMGGIRYEVDVVSGEGISTVTFKDYRGEKFTAPVRGATPSSKPAPKVEEEKDAGPIVVDKYKGKYFSIRQDDIFPKSADQLIRKEGGYWQSEKQGLRALDKLIKLKTSPGTFHDVERAWKGKAIAMVHEEFSKPNSKGFQNATGYVFDEMGVVAKYHLWKKEFTDWVDSGGGGGRDYDRAQQRIEDIYDDYGSKRRNIPQDMLEEIEELERGGGGGGGRGRKTPVKSIRTGAKLKWERR